MATVAPPPSETADLLQKLSLDSQKKGLEISEPAKKPSSNTGDVMNGQNQTFDRSLTPVLPEFMDPNMCYMPNYASYYYGGYDGTANDWDYINPEGVDMTQGVYGENGSVMYHSYGYAPYSPYTPAGSPVPTVGHDGQLYGAQQYQYPTPYFQPSTPTSGPYSTPAAPPKGEKSTTGAGDKPTLAIETANVNSNGITNVGVVKANSGSAPHKSFQNSFKNNNGSFGRGTFPGGVPTSAYQDPRFGYDSLVSPVPWMDVPLYSDYSRPMTNTSIKPPISSGNGIPSRNQNNRSHLMGLHSTRPLSGMNTNGYLNRIYPNKMYNNQYTNTYRSGYGYGSGGYDSRTGGRGWLSVDSKYKPRGRGNGPYGYGNENMDGLNELNRGPRAKSSKNQKVFTPVVLDVKGQNIPVAGTNDVENEKPCVDSDRAQYNRADFPETYLDAKFYIIKSYSEDDVHKSIKYSVWASTQNGNKKLDAAYQEAQQKSGGCPIFLLFSVNTSGQFVGIAEMLGPVDFNKSLEYWQQDKWVGCFPVKWHIVKDVPNSMLKHITLENNENKPVTNSRDTQEVKLDQGLQLLKIFKEYSSKQCILDDFDFYEDRQKRIQEKKAKQQQFQKQVWEGKPADEKNKDGSNLEATVPNSNDTASELVKDPTPAVHINGDTKVSENATAVKGEVLKVSKPIVLTEKKVIENGVANGC
ncbi:YTH domain-containing protein [Heracleum sosnowskyi]|uniref:YTH domain-containing family protein n=1 Tax=Heracleum sosnowskyi TaxID=360622 RepID=A0AAD8LZI5_9APIA|nr:YTH domain-containing protein [Heracleum sosnowskyi]